MRKRILFAVLPLLVGCLAIRVDTEPRSVEPPETSEALWRFDTHG
jgi:hypothetical protein